MTMRSSGYLSKNGCSSSGGLAARQETERAGAAQVHRQYSMNHAVCSMMQDLQQLHSGMPGISDLQHRAVLAVCVKSSGQVTGP